VKTKNFFLMALQPLWALSAFQSPDLFTIDRTPWTSDQLIARPLPKHRTAQTQNRYIYTPNFRALRGIRIHDHRVRASKDSSCLRPLGYCDRKSKNFVCILSQMKERKSANILFYFSCKTLRAERNCVEYFCFLLIYCCKFQVE
jgi:hypothetical protein